jgi:protein-L-isoaspartate O-methyltransferase
VTTPLEDYDLERAEFARVVAAVRRIADASEAQLASLEWLVETIRDVGLAPIPEAAATYAGEEAHLNASQQGVIQLPREFARWLQLAAAHRPARYLEIGCFNGATASLAAAYLARFRADFEALSIDVWPGFVFYREVRALIPLRYEAGRTSFDLRGQPFDVVFIDGDHSFEWAWADYDNVGRAAPVCAFHDVNNAPYRELPMGGVCGVWDLVKREEAGPGVEFTEIFEHPTRELLGIGVRVRAEGKE